MHNFWGGGADFMLTVFPAACAVGAEVFPPLILRHDCLTPGVSLGPPHPPQKKAFETVCSDQLLPVTVNSSIRRRSRSGV